MALAVHDQGIFELTDAFWGSIFPGEGGFRPVPGYRMFVLKTMGHVKILLERATPETLVIVQGETGHPCPPGYQLEEGTGMSTKEACFLMLEGAFQIEGHPINLICIAYGDKHLCASIARLVQRGNMVLAPKIPVDENYIAPPEEGPVDFTTIQKEKVLAYDCSAKALFRLLNNPSASQFTKQASTLITLFPYIKRNLPNTVSLTQLTVGEDLAVEGGIGAILNDDGKNSGEDLTLLTIFSLGAAYSNMEKIPVQIGRRARAVAAALGAPAPEANIVKNVFAASRFDPGNTSTVIDDLIGLVVCTLPTGEVKHELTLPELPTVAQLNALAQLSDVAIEILEQMRLVYSHYHATSIHFVLPIIGKIGTYLSTSDVHFLKEITDFQKIQTTVTNAPYLGLRGKSPPHYHIKNYCRLVYLGLLFHKNSLVSEDEKKDFEGYKFKEIRAMIPSQDDVTMVENIAEMMPKASLSAIAGLLTHVPVDKGDALLVGRSEADKATIMEILRAMDEPGPWASAIFEKENGAVLRSISAEATALLKNCLDENYDTFAQMINLTQDQAKKFNDLVALQNWRTTLMKSINKLLPITDRIPEVRAGKQSDMRKTLIENMTATIARIEGGPGYVPPPTPQPQRMEQDQ